MKACDNNVEYRDLSSLRRCGYGVTIINVMKMREELLATDTNIIINRVKRNYLSA
jgi:hypothetical protein